MSDSDRGGGGRGSALRLEGIAKTFSDGTVALEGLDLDVRTGEFLSILGPSGCGKSTALRLIAGLAEPTSGTVHRPAANPAAASEPDRPGDVRAGDVRAGDVGFVFQDPTLMPWATVFDTVRLPLRLIGANGPAARHRVEEALAMVGLADFARAHPRRLSGGMRMRVSIARALVTRPRLLLMDEPFAALDEITRFRLNDDLLALWRERRFTTVFVTHSVYESVYLSERIAVMTARPGRIARQIVIDPDAPRDAEFRLSHGFAEHCRGVSRALQAAMEERR